MNEKWLESIPENGTLVRVKDGVFNEIIVLHPRYIKKFGKEQLAAVLEECTPLTANEIWQFMPWNAIDSAPTGIRVMVINKHDSLQIVTIWKDSERSKYKKWLPLPVIPNKDYT
jgi:hypothetical protein